MPLEKRPPTDVLVVDAHCHLGYFRNFHIPDNDSGGVVAVFDQLGIDAGVVAAHAGISSDFRRGNDEVAEAADRHPGRIFGYCCINPNYPDDVAAELERCFDHPSFRGIKLHPELHDDYPLDGPGYRRVWDFAADRKVPVLVHSYFGGDSLDVIAATAQRYQGATLVLGHGGLDLGVPDVVRLVRRLPNVVLDLTGPASWDGLVEYLVSEVGAERLVFGSDIPFVNPAVQLGGCAYARIDADDRRQILGDNAAQLFGLWDDLASV
ncbi:MAG: amidohydrolase family protein [Thermocrispum sp.]